MQAILDGATAVRIAVVGRTQKEQERRCNQLMNKNIRSIDADIVKLHRSETNIKSMIKNASKSSQREAWRAQQNNTTIRIYARELIRTRRQTARLHTCKAQLESIKMQYKEANAVKQIEDKLKIGTKMMKEVNTLVRLPELTGSMRELSQELMKAGVVEEMTNDILPELDAELMGEDEEAETEVDKVLGEILGTPVLPEANVAGPFSVETEPSGAEQDASLEQMKGRLEALRS